MADSPRRMMEKVIAFKRPHARVSECAQYALGREDWLELQRGSHSQAYFRDFILKLIQYREDFDVDDTEIPKIISGMMDTGYLWETFNVVKHPDRIARSIMVAFNSVQTAGFESTASNFLAVFRVIIDKPAWVLPFAVGEDNDRFHPMIVERLVTDHEAAERLIMLVRSGITDPLLALSLIEEEVVAPLVAGAL